MNEKICVQCCRQLPLTQFKSYKTKGGLKYRNYCHQCTYNNNRFNILSKERKVRQLTEQEAGIYDMTLQVFDIYAEMGGTIGSGAYNELRGKSQREATLEQQLAAAQQLLTSKTNTDDYVQENRYLEGLKVDTLNDELKQWLSQSMEEWCKKQYKPSFLRAVYNDLKQREGPSSSNIDGLKKLSTKLWDYEEYLAAQFKNKLPDWLDGEELIV